MLRFKDRGIRRMKVWGERGKLNFIKYPGFLKPEVFQRTWYDLKEKTQLVEGQTFTFGSSNEKLVLNAPLLP